VTATPVIIYGYTVERYDVFGDPPHTVITTPTGKRILERQGVMPLDKAEVFIQGYEAGHDQGVEDGEELFKRRNWSPL
jgi:hypothetical protein